MTKRKRKNALSSYEFQQDLTLVNISNWQTPILPLHGRWRSHLADSYEDAFTCIIANLVGQKSYQSMHIYIYVAIGPFPIKDDLDDQGPTVRIRNLLTDDFLWIFAYWGTICGILRHVGPPRLFSVVDFSDWNGCKNIPVIWGKFNEIQLFKVLK